MMYFTKWYIFKSLLRKMRNEAHKHRKLQVENTYNNNILFPTPITQKAVTNLLIHPSSPTLVIYLEEAGPDDHYYYLILNINEVNFHC